MHSRSGLSRCMHTPQAQRRMFEFCSIDRKTGRLSQQHCCHNIIDTNTAVVAFHVISCDFSVAVVPSAMLWCRTPCDVCTSCSKTDASFPAPRDVQMCYFAGMPNRSSTSSSSNTRGRQSSLHTLRHATWCFANRFQWDQRSKLLRV